MKYHLYKIEELRGIMSNFWYVTENCSNPSFLVNVISILVTTVGMTERVARELGRRALLLECGARLWPEDPSPPMDCASNTILVPIGQTSFFRTLIVTVGQ